MLWFIYAFSTALLATIAVLVEKKTLKKIDPLLFSSVIAIFNFIIALPFALKIDYTSINLKIILIMAFASWFGTLGYLFITKAMKELDVSIVSPLIMFGPALTAIVAFLFLGETLTLMQIGGMALLILGSFLLKTHHEHSIKDFLKLLLDNIKSKNSIIFVFLSLFVYSISANFDRLILHKLATPVSTYIVFIHLFITLNFMILLAYNKKLDQVSVGMKNVGKWILLVSILTVSYRYLQMKATELANVSLVISVKRMSVLFSTIIGGTIFHEKNLTRRIIGSLVMFAGVILIILKEFNFML